MRFLSENSVFKFLPLGLVEKEGLVRKCLEGKLFVDDDLSRNTLVAIYTLLTDFLVFISLFTGASKDELW